MTISDTMFDSIYTMLDEIILWYREDMGPYEDSLINIIEVHIKEAAKYNYTELPDDFDTFDFRGTAKKIYATYLEHNG